MKFQHKLRRMLAIMLEKEMAPHSSVLAWNPRDGRAWWAAIYGVAQSWTRLKQLSSSSSSSNNANWWQLKEFLLNFQFPSHSMFLDPRILLTLKKWTSISFLDLISHVRFFRKASLISPRLFLCVPLLPSYSHHDTCLPMKPLASVSLHVCSHLHL